MNTKDWQKTHGLCGIAADRDSVWYCEVVGARFVRTAPQPVIIDGKWNRKD